MEPSKKDSMGNQRGEVVTAVMVVMMCVMMIFGGMHMFHGEHGDEEDHARVHHKHSHDGDMQHLRGSSNEQAPSPNEAEDK